MTYQGQFSAGTEGTPDNMNAMLLQRNTVGNRPDAGFTGCLFYATDEGKLYRDNGSSWDEIIPADQAAGTGSPRTLGTGAAQAAAGDHGHTLVDEWATVTDDQDAADTLEEGSGGLYTLVADMDGTGVGDPDWTAQHVRVVGGIGENGLHITLAATSGIWGNLVPVFWMEIHVDDVQKAQRASNTTARIDDDAVPVQQGVQVLVVDVAAGSRTIDGYIWSSDNGTNEHHLLGAGLYSREIGW